MAGRGSGASFSAYVLALLLFLLSARTARADDAPDDVERTSAIDEPPKHAGITKVVEIFYIDERAYEGLPYTLFHRVAGSVIGVDAEYTTYLITSTRIDQRPSPTHSRTDNITTGIPTLTSRSSVYPNATGHPSMITQGISSFLFTGTRFGPNNTVINHCSLNGTVSAVCNLTHIGSAWYSTDPSWNGTYSTYSYNWTSGVRWGFAPVTITMGAELLGSSSNPTASRSANAAAPGRGTPQEGGYFLGGGLAMAAAFVFGMAIIL